jgi:hypothetical protein
MTPPPETSESGRPWLRCPAWLSGFAGRTVWPYRKAVIFLAVALMGVPLLLRLVGVPFATTFTLMVFVCVMRWLLAAWPRSSETGKRRHRWLVPLAWVFGFMLFIGAWAMQPYFGANVCPAKGFMWTTDFVEEVRPTIHSNIRRQSIAQVGWPPAGVTVAQFIAVADQALDLLKQCVAERGVDYCRYAGPDPNGTMMGAYTIEGPSAIAPKDRHKYRYLTAGLDYEISMVPEDTGGNLYLIRTSRFGESLFTGGKICELGCWCNVYYGR